MKNINYRMEEKTNMSNIVLFAPKDTTRYRGRFVFMNRTVPIVGNDGEKKNYPCLVLYEKDTDIPVLVRRLPDLLLYEAKKYDPDITAGIALGAYAGIREGEMVNVTCGRVKTIRGSYGSISGIEVDLTAKAPYFIDWKVKMSATKKTD